MKTTPTTINVCFEFTQTPNSSGRLLAAYEMLFGGTELGDNPFDRNRRHPIMPHVRGTDEEPYQSTTALS